MNMYLTLAVFMNLTDFDKVDKFLYNISVKRSEAGVFFYESFFIFHVYLIAAAFCNIIFNLRYAALYNFFFIRKILTEHNKILF